MSSWRSDLDKWFEPFVNLMANAVQREWAPVYLRGLLSDARRKSVTAMADVVAPGQSQGLHHFIKDAPWDERPLLDLLAQRVQRAVGGRGAHFIIDDVALVKKGRQSVAVARQYCGETGKSDNCQVLVSLTLARDEVPIGLALRLFVPESWAKDSARCAKAGVPAERQVHRPKWRLALDELDRVRALGVTADDAVADAGYGSCAEFRAGLWERGLPYGVGIFCSTLVYPADVALQTVPSPTGRRQLKHPRPSVEARRADALIGELGAKDWRSVNWREGTQGPLQGRFARMRVKPADGQSFAQHQHLPGCEQWLVCEERSATDRRYYLSSLTASATWREVVGQIKARWSCEQMHEQLKQELGLDHFEGRSWTGLHHHTTLALIALAFLQSRRVGEKISADDSPSKLGSTT